MSNTNKTYYESKNWNTENTPCIKWQVHTWLIFSCVEVLPIKTADDVHSFVDIAGWKLRMVLAVGKAHEAAVLWPFLRPHRRGSSAAEGHTPSTAPPGLGELRRPLEELWGRTTGAWPKELKVASHESTGEWQAPWRQKRVRVIAHW
jgi:hypothetical protein